MKKNNYLEDKPYLKKVVFVVFLVIPILLALIFETRDYFLDKEISKNIVVSKGIVIKVKYGRNALIYWKFKANGIIYNNYTANTRQFNFVKFCPNKSCLGDSVIVEYSKLNPENNRIVIGGMRSYGKML